MTQSFLSLLLTQAWQIAVIAIIVAIVVRIAAKNRPHIAHALWILVLIKCITPPLWGHSLGVFSRLQTWTELNDETAPSDINTSNVQKATFVIEPPSVEVQFPPEPMLQPSDSIAAIGEFDEIEFESLAELSYPQPTDIESEISPSLIEPEEQISQTALIPLTAESNAPSVHRVWLLIGLVFGAIVTLFIMIVRCLHCVRQIQLHRTTEFDDPLRDRLQQLAAQLGIRRIPNIIVSDVLFGPAVLGLLRHTIVLPRCLFPSELLPSSTPPLAFLDPILAHELLHIRRGDLRTGTLQAIVQSLWWFHPAVWFCNRWLSREAERCCDEQVIAELGCTPAHYARSLLSVIECKHRLQPIPVFPGMKPVEITSQRMERIMSLKNGLKKRTPIWCWLMILALALVVLPGAVAKPPIEESAPNETNEDTELLENDDVRTPLPDFEGNEYWSDADLQKHLSERERTAGIDSGPSLASDCEAIKSKYANAGFLFAEVTAKSLSSDDLKIRGVRFQVKEGQRYESRDIRIELNNRITASAENPKRHSDESSPSPNAVPEINIPALPLHDWIRNSSDPLVKLIWDARNTSQRRFLMTDQRTPWQFMNGLEAMRGDFLIRDDDEAVVGLDWLKSNSEALDRPWFQKTEHGGQPDPRPVPIWFDDHVEQFVATLAMNDVPLDATFPTADGKITMRDMIKHLQMTVNETKQTPWTLIALSKYLPRNETWTNAKGEQWSIERLVRIELDKPRHTATPLSLMSLAVARDHYFSAGETLDGIWLQADQRILAAIEKARPSQTSDGKIITTYSPFQYPRFHYRSRFGPPIPPQRMAPNETDRVHMDLEGNRRIRLAAFPTDMESTNRAQMLLFLTIAIPVNELGKEWIRREIETAANDLVADWSDPEIRSPFYQTTQALTVYLERFPKYLETVAEAGLSRQFPPVHVRVKGMVQQPSSYQYVGNNDLRLLEVITRAGGPLNESADTVSIIRNVGKQPEPTVLQVNLKRLKSGADPNFYVMPGDEVLVHTADIVKQPLEASIRLADDFVLSPESPISGSTVILFLNDKPITVEKFIAGGWDRLQRTQGIPDDLKRAIVCELIKTDLPQFVYREILLQHFAVEAPKYNLEDTPQLREAEDKLFLETFERNSKSVADPQKQVQFLVAALAKSSTSLAVEKKKIQLAQYTRSLNPNTLDKSEALVIRYVQTLVMKADLRRPVSVNFKDASLTDVLRSIAADHNLNIAARNLEIASRIVDKPATVTFHCEVRPLGEALTAIVEPFGLSAHPDGETLIVEFANFEAAMAKFRSLPGPPSFAVYGIVKNTGWHKLEKEVRLLDAIEMAGGVEDSEGVSIAITNADIIDGKAIPVSMSLRVLQNDKSGKLNRIINDGDMITVARNVSAEAPRAKRPEVLMFGNGVNSDSGLVGTFKYDDPAEPIVLRGVGLVSNLSHGHQVTDLKKDSEEAPTSERLVLYTYALADLVVYRQPAIVSVSRSTEHTGAAGTVPPKALALTPEKTEIATQSRPSTLPQQTQTAAAYKADFAPMTELIKATVQPESWDPPGNATMAIEKESLSLVIRQTEAAHSEIAKLFSQLRNAQDQAVHVRCQILELTEETDSKWLVENFPLHELQHGTRWALLSRQRSEAFQLSLRKRKTSILSVPQVMTISGQSATIQVGTTNPESDIATGIRLQLTPHVLTDSKVIRMQHSFSTGSFDHEMPLPMESLVGSGQTLLILIDNPADSDNSKAAKSKYLLLMTPNYVPVFEEEELIATPIQFP